MPCGDCLILMGVGGFFIILGTGGIIWGGREEKGYYNTIAGRPDVREFMDHWPLRPQMVALKIGGWISVIIGLILIIAGIVLWL